VFDLDRLRRGDRARYEERLAAAWSFLEGDLEMAEAHARQNSVGLLRRVLAFDVGALVLPADPRHARYAVLRPGRAGLEGFLIERGVFLSASVLADDVHEFAADLLAHNEPRTTPEDVDVVLRWFGAQRPPARLVHLPDDPLASADAIEVAALALGEA
jgi:hypothetical protein